MTQFVRPSRWWILAVPVAVSLMLASSGYRVNQLWYVLGQHNATAKVGPQEWASATWAFDDALGETSRTFQVRFTGWGAVSDVTEERLGSGGDTPLPKGMVSRQVTLEFRAAPDQPMKYCNLTLVDDQDRLYRLGDLIGPFGELDPCIPEDAPGPESPLSPEQKRGQLPLGSGPRPSEWTVTPALVVPEDAKFTELRVAYENPNYVSITLPR